MLADRRERGDGRAPGVSGGVATSAVGGTDYRRGMERSEILAAAAAAHAARIAEAGGDAGAARERAEQIRKRADGLTDRIERTEASDAARDAERRRAGEADRAASRTEGSLSDWQRMGTRRGVTPDEQVRTAWTIAGVPERGDARALANILLSTAGHAGRVADAARRNPRLSGAASAAARRTVRRYTDHGADMASLGDVLDEPSQMDE